MPFLNFTELKGLANSFNPLNIFSEDSPPSTSTSSHPTTSTPTSSSAEAGPGPSSQRSRQEQSSHNLNVPSSSSAVPTRPSLKGVTASDTSSLEDESGRRRSSGTASVMFAQGLDGEDRADQSTSKSRRKSRPLSGVSGVTIGSTETDRRRKKKAPLDTYIIVRPPPTASKNPLNLQIQLVVKDPRGRNRSESGVSFRSNSVSTNLTSTSAATASPLASPAQSPAAIDIPPPQSITQATELSSSVESKLRSDSPSAISSDEIDTTTANGASLARSNSVKSNISSNTSNTSASTFGGGSRRRVEPMFNLAVHNVMQPTVVTDAATDVKVAKFLKRTLDVAGVGILEPSEVWLPPSRSGSTSNLFAPEEGPTRARSRPTSVMSLTTPLSPTVTRSTEGGGGGGGGGGIRNSLDLSSLKRTSIDFKNLRLEVGQDGRAKKFFGNMFKKKNSQDFAAVHGAPLKKKSPSPSFSSVEPVSPNPGSGPFLVVKGPSAHGSPASVEHGHNPHSHGHSTFGTAPLVVHRRSSGTIITPDGAVTGLTAATVPPPAATAHLGTSPAASVLGDKITTLPMLPSSRPVGYTWTVRKWAKKNTEGWAAHLVAAAGAGLELVNGGFTGDGEDEVVFEWVKLRVPSNAVGTNIMRRFSTTGTIASLGPKTKKARSRSRATSTKGDVTPVDEPHNSALTVRPNSRSASVPPSPNLSIMIDPRPEPVRRVSGANGISPSRRVERSGSSSPPSDLDENDQDSLHTIDITAEEDSDPEDSETPWTCSVWVKKTGHRQLLGTLTPAPHHPKVIGVLKIPVNLVPVTLTDIKTKEGETRPGHEELASRVREEVALNEENLKDVVCVTAMWLVAREEFGGLGKKRRG